VAATTDGPTATYGSRQPLPRSLIVAVAVGMPLTPLNSTMIAMALGRIEQHFDVTLSATTWLVSSFYIMACAGQPMMGKLADHLGPRRVMCAGIALCGLIGLLTPAAPTFGWLVVSRVFLALGTSTVFPAGLAVVRRAAGDDRPPTAAMAAMSVAASVSAAFGPVLGGTLITLAGWQAIFTVNVPLAVVAIVVALRWIPADDPTTTTTLRALLRDIDLPGMALFAGTLVALLSFLLSITTSVLWLLVPVIVLGSVLMVWWERVAPRPFLDLRVLRRNHALLGVLASFLGVNIVFYAIYYGMPVWLEQVRGFSPALAGLVLLPLSAIGTVLTPLVARYVGRHGPRRPVVLGACLLVSGSATLLVLGTNTPAALIAVLAVLLGFPNAFNNFGLQTMLYTVTPTAETGQAAGLFQTARYGGAICSAVILGVIYGDQITQHGLRTVALVAIGISTALALTSGRVSRNAGGANDR
jgi:MFS family permease